MRKLFPQLVSFLMASCLSADPSLAAALSHQQSIAGHLGVVQASIQDRFQEEALEAQLRYAHRLIANAHGLFAGTQISDELKEAAGLIPPQQTAIFAQRLIENLREYLGHASADISHVGFGIRMAGKARASEKAIVERKNKILGSLDRGDLPSEFQRENIRINGSSFDVVIHKDVLGRVKARGINLNEFIQNTIKIRGPKYAPRLIERLNGKRLVIDALPASPSLYGNCQNDGYVYVNLNAPSEMDVVGISHEWMHEAGLFSGSKQDEDLLAEQDRAIMAELGLSKEELHGSLGNRINQASALLKPGVVAPLFVGDREELERTLTPFLAQIGWDRGRIKTFYDAAEYVFTLRPQRKTILSGLRSQFWQILLDVGRRQDLRDYENLRRLYDGLNRIKTVDERHSPWVIVNSMEITAFGNLIRLDHNHRLLSLLALLCPELDRRPVSPLLEGIIPKEIGRAVLSHSPDELISQLEDRSAPQMLLAALPPEIRREAAKRVLDRLNANAIRIEDLDWSAWRDFYMVVIESFEDRVGLLTNAAAFRRMYEQQFDGLRETIEQDRIDTETMDPDYIAEALDQDPETFDLEAHRAESLNHLLGNQQMESTELFNYNPGPEMLEQVIDFFRQDKGEHPLRLSPAEANTFIWLVRHIPKKDGFTRDRRRQVHRYLLAMWEDGYYDAEAKTRKFMGDVIAAIDIPRMSPEGVTTVMNFMLQFTNLSHPLRKTAAKVLAERVEAWRQRPGSNKRAGLGPEHFKAMTDLINDVLIDHLLSNALTLSDAEKQRLRSHVTQHSAAWDRRDFLRLVASYHSFQNPEGKRHTEDFLRQLMNSEVRGDRFTSLPRYDWSAEKKKWLGAVLRRVWQSGYTKAVPIQNLGPLGAAQFQGVYRDIMEHLGIQPPSQPQDLPQQIQNWIRSPENQDIPSSERETLAATVGDILAALAVGAPISAEQVREWRQRLVPQDKVPHWYQSREDWREILVNLDQLLRIQAFDWSQVTGLTFEITDDPVEFALSGTEPYQTCQRLNEPTGQNNDGRPVNRLRQGQFLLARLVAQKKDGTSTVLARSHLELAEGIRRSDFGSLMMPRSPIRAHAEHQLMKLIFGVDTTEEQEPAGEIGASKVLLVERVYQQGLLPTGIFYREILKWALRGPRSTPLFDYALLAGRDAEHAEQIFVRLLPSDGPIYRDTFKEGVWNAIDLKAFARGDESVEAVTQDLEEKGATTITHSPSPSPSGSWFQTKSVWYEQYVAGWFEPLVSLGISALGAAWLLHSHGLHGMDTLGTASLTTLIGLGVALASALIFRYPHKWLRGQEIFNGASVRELTTETAGVGFLLGASLALPSSVGLMATIAHVVTILAVTALTARHLAINNPRAVEFLKAA